MKDRQFIVIPDTIFHLSEGQITKFYNIYKQQGNSHLDALLEGMWNGTTPREGNYKYQVCMLYTWN